jgi:hypothetical protein
VDNTWILREQLEIVICLRPIQSSLSFSIFWGVGMVLFGWAVLIQFVKDDDDIGRVSGSKFESSEERR